MNSGQSQIDPCVHGGSEVPFNPDELLARLGGDREIAVEVVELFLTDCPVTMRHIHEAIANRDADRLESSAHKLRGAIGHLATRSAYETARRVEAMGKCNDIDGAARTVVVLETNVNRLVGALREFVAGAA